VGSEHVYRAYVIGSDGLIMHRVDLLCDSDEAAMERATLLADIFDVELWDGGRKIAEFKASKPSGYSSAPLKR
jgi:hypothetical protein